MLHVHSASVLSVSSVTFPLMLSSRVASVVTWLESLADDMLQRSEDGNRGPSFASKEGLWASTYVRSGYGECEGRGVGGGLPQKTRREPGQVALLKATCRQG